MQITNHLIKKQQLNIFRHVDMVKITNWNSNQESEFGRKVQVTLNVAELLMPDGLSISENDLLGFFSHNDL